MVLTFEQIQHVVADYFKDKPVKKVWLFGSYARGEADEQSDIDVLVDIQKEAKVGLEYYGWYQDLQETLSKKVDVLSYGWVNERIWPRVEKDMVLMYEK